MRGGRVLMLLASAALGASGCNVAQRSLMSARVQDWDVEMRAQSKTVEATGVEAVTVALFASKNESAESNIGILKTATFQDLRGADAMMSRLKAEHCSDDAGARLAFRLQDAVTGDDAVGTYRVLYAFKSRVVLAADPVTSSGCGESFSFIPDADPWLVQALEMQANPQDDPTLMQTNAADPVTARVTRSLNGLEAFAIAADESVHLPEALDFTLRRRPESWQDALLLYGARSWTSEQDWLTALAPQREKIRAVMAKGDRGAIDLEGHLLRRLLPYRVQPPLSPDAAVSAWVSELLMAAPNTQRKTSFAREALTLCWQESRWSDCYPWRLEAMAEVFAQDNNSAFCNEALALAQSYLKSAPRRADKAVLGILRGLGSCATPENRNAALLAALAYQSKDLPEPTLACRVGATRDEARSCMSLPNYAAARLTSECSPAAVEAAKAVLALDAAQTPTASRSAALCVIAHCESRDQFNATYKASEWLSDPKPPQLCGF